MTMISKTLPATGQQPTDSPTNITLEPDWDVINEIRWTLESDGVKGGTIFHIQGHQDKKKPYNELSLQAQLNVDADRLATTYQAAPRSTTSNRTHLPTFVGTPAH
jgi:hypothetical protein